ncbi:AraC family transcriptional regulator [Enterococcus sp. AZ007]|uniref:AraC family transcriptional regulator n=1 Tax=Enterococcus sp. AZ007 TaxID=2774839 RepID=UPI003F6935F2
MYFEINEFEQEQTEHQSGDFPIGIYHRTLRKSRNDELVWHWHEEFQLTLVLTGSLKLSVEKSDYSVDEGKGILINSRRLHHAVPLTDAAEYICIDFSPRFINEALYQSSIKEIESNSSFECALLTLTASQQAILSEIVEANRSGSYNFLKIYELILSCLNDIEKYPASQAKKEDHSIYRLLDYVHQNYHRNITVAEIAQVIPINKNKCTHLFKEYTNQSPMNYTIDYRLLKAKELLLNTDSSVSEICFAVGFNNLSYFIAKFNKRFHSSPTNYRKKFHRVEV